MLAPAGGTRPLSLVLRAVVAVLVAGVAVLTAAQQAGTAGPGWLELTRYLPYPVMLAPAVLALLLSIGLGRRWIAASALSVLLVATVAMGFEWHVRVPADDSVRLMTWNIKAEQARLRPGGLAELAGEVARLAPDILVMQDATGLIPARPGTAKTAVFGLPEVFADSQYVIASRFALRACTPRRIDAGAQSLHYVRCTVDVRGIALDLVAVHLESPRDGLNAARHEGLEGTLEWRRNHEDRLAQARALARDLSAGTRPLIVAGDLNAPQSSAVVGSLLALDLRDAFASAGRGWGYSYGQALRPRFSFLRIDHILASPDIGITDSFVGGGQASDHRPVIADLVLPSAAAASAAPRQTSKKTVSSAP